MSKKRNQLLRSALMGCLLAAQSHAANIFWDGGGVGNNIQTAANWSGGVLPGTGDSALIGTAAAQGAATPEINSTVVPDIGVHLWLWNGADLNILPGANAFVGGGFALATHGQPGTVVTQTGGTISAGYGGTGAGFGGSWANINNGSQADYNISAGEMTIRSGVLYSIGGGGGGASTMAISGSGSVSIPQVSLNGNNIDGSETGILELSGAGLFATGFIRNTHVWDGVPQTEGKIHFVGGPATAAGISGGTLRADLVDYDDPDGSVFNVGNGATLSLGAGGTHQFDHGLTIQAGGVLATDNNGAADADLGTTQLTLSSGTVLDYSINGEINDSDTWSVSVGGLTLAAGSYDLIVDAVAGSIGLTDGDGLGDGLGGGGFWDIFSWSGGGGPTFAEFTATTWNISATENTRVGSLGTVEYFGTDTSGRIYLTGFSAFAIPEPSTTMLLGMGAMVLLLRRRIRR